MNQAWLINSGFAWDSSMVNDQDRTVTFPVGQTFRFGLGSEWQTTPKLNVAFSYDLAYTGNMPVSQNWGPWSVASSDSFPTRM